LCPSSTPISESERHSRATRVKEFALTALDLARSIVQALEARKGENILLLDISEIASFTDYFVLCTGTSDRMLDALAESTLESIHQQNRKHGRKQGQSREGWVVVDCGDVVVHLFSPDQRAYYNLEEFWQDGRILLKLQ
jgi:ribosome-associated protein